MLGLIIGSLAGILLFSTFSVVFMPISFLLPRKKSSLFSRRVMTLLSKIFLFTIGTRVEVIHKDKEAIDNLNYDDGIVVISNHQSNIDTPILSGFLPIDVGFVAKHEMEKWPFFGPWMKRTDCVFLNRENPREGIKGIQKAISIIQDGHPIVVFPEGERTLTGDMINFKKGSFRLATNSKGIIVPVTIKGAFDIQKRGSVKIYLFKKVKIIIDKPIDTKGLSNEELKGLNKKVHDIIENNLKDYS